MLALLLLFLQSAGDQGPVYDGRLRQIEVRIPRIEAGVVRLDGVLDEPVWRQAALLKGFTQYRPVDSRPAEDSTEVLVFYASDAMYFGIRAYEAHGNVVRATLADRDNIGADDNIQILLDTFLDRRRALLFEVNPLGVQQDGVRSEGIAGAAGGANAGGRFDGVVDLNPDYVYESHGRVTPWGFEVEVRIPFKRLRYQSGATQDWGMQVVRGTQHTGYEDTWTPVVRASASFLIQSGTLKNLGGMRRGVVMDVNPEFTSHVDGAPAGGGAGVSLRPGRSAAGRESALGHHAKPQHDRHGQPRFFPGGSRCRPGDRQRALRPVFPREAAVFPGRPRAIRYAQRVDLHATNPRPSGGRQAHGKSGWHR